MAYPETRREGPFLEKVTEKKIDFRSGMKIPKPSNMTEEEWAKVLEKMAEAQAKSDRTPRDKYQLVDQAGLYVGWFGILRSSTRDDKVGVTTLLLEHKYFDGLTDLHQQVVSLFGAGDFTATMTNKAPGIPPLALVRVYGKVAKDKNGAVTVDAEFVRFWDWGLFAFMDYGKDRTNPKWLELRKVGGGKPYERKTSHTYYEDWLGKR